MSASVKSKSVEFVGKITAVTIEMLTLSHSLKRGSNQLDCFLYLTKKVVEGKICFNRDLIRNHRSTLQ